jgi:hypothetical protein
MKMNTLQYETKSRDDSVGIATTLWARQGGYFASILDRGKRLLFSPASRTNMRATQSRIQWVPGDSSGAEVKNSWNYIFTHQLYSWRDAYLVRRSPLSLFILQSAMA